MNPVPVLVGPTAVGKTAVAVNLCGRLNAEVISADSRQVYRGMRIGTGQPTDDQLRRARHHLVSIIEPTESYSAARFRKHAAEAIEDVRSRGRLPMVVGGTGLYVRALFAGLFEGAGAFEEVRDELARRLEREGLEALYDELVRLDPESAALHPNDTARVLRALEVVKATGKPIGEWRREKQTVSRWRAAIVGLRLSRKLLAQRIEKRVRAMFAGGLVEEARALREVGDVPALTGIGYKEALAYMDARTSREEAVERTCARTRQFAKRQMTWFLHQHDVVWLDVDETSVDDAAEAVVQAWDEMGVSL